IGIRQAMLDPRGLDRNLEGLEERLGLAPTESGDGIHDGVEGRLVFRLKRLALRVFADLDPATGRESLLAENVLAVAVWRKDTVFGATVTVLGDHDVVQLVLALLEGKSHVLQESGERIGLQAEAAFGRERMRRREDRH